MALNRFLISAALVMLSACGETVQLSELCAKPAEGKPMLACTGYQSKDDMPLPAQG